MKTNSWRIFFGCFFCLFAFFTVAEERGLVARKLAQDAGLKMGEYRALVIGINQYQDKQIPNLNTAVNDAGQLAKVLHQVYGFNQVIQLLNQDATASAIQRALRQLANRSKEEDSVLIYYAGHGDQDTITGDGWWVPSDATAQDPSTYIDNSIVQKYVRAIPARHVLLVSDSCFSGTFFGQARAMPRVIDDKYYASLYKERSRWGITSGNLTPVSDSGSGGHSIFAWQFIKALRDNEKPYLTPREIYQRIAPVIRNNSEQMPITNPLRHAGDAGGEFIFIRSLPSPPEPPKPIVQPAPAVTPPPIVSAAAVVPVAKTADFSMWQLVRDSNDMNEIQLFLDTYPTSPFKALALSRLKVFQQQEHEKALKKKLQLAQEREKKIKLQLGQAQKSMKKNTLSGFHSALKELDQLYQANPKHKAVNASVGELERRIVRYVKLNMNYGTNLKQSHALLDQSLASTFFSDKKQFKELQQALKRKEELARKKPKSKLKPKKEEDVTDVSIGF